MLPDFAVTKRMFTDAFARYMRRKAQEISPYRMVRTHFIHEGRILHIARSDKSESTSGVVHMSTPIEFKLDEIEELTAANVMAKIDAAVVDMVRHQVNLVRERMANEIPASQSVDGHGRKLDGELLLQGLERMQVEFYPDGRPHEIFLDGDPSRLAVALQELENSPPLKERFQKLLMQKQEEWRAREANRKLVG